MVENNNTPQNPDEILTCVCGWHGPAGDAKVWRQGQHLRADCPECGTYLKYLAQSIPKLFFGKFKGKPVDEVAREDPRYLAWVLDKSNIRLTQSLRRSIAQALGRTEQMETNTGLTPDTTGS